MKKREDCCSDLSRGSRQPAMQYYTTVCSRPYAIYIGYIIEKLSEGEGVSIHYFGKLVPHYQTERPGRNLRTGEECKIRARTSVKFKASEILIQKLNPGK